MNMKLTKKQILELHATLVSCGDLRGAKFAYIVAKNILLLEPEVQAIQKAYIPSKEFMEYDGERIKLAESHAEKVNGKPEIVKENNIDSYNIKDKEKFMVELKVLQAKYEPIIKAREEQIRDVDKILEEEVDVKLHTISTKDIPSDIQVKQMRDIFIMIEEEKKVIN